MAYQTIDEYIATFPAKTQEVLQRIRKIMSREVPQATETISYGIPTFKLYGRYVMYFAGYEKHVSIYPIHLVPESFQKEIEPYRSGKGTVQFALGKPVPYDIIKKIVRHLTAAAQQK